MILQIFLIREFRITLMNNNNMQKKQLNTITVINHILPGGQQRQTRVKYLLHGVLSEALINTNLNDLRIISKEVSIYRSNPQIRPQLIIIFEKISREIRIKQIIGMMSIDFRPLSSSQIIELDKEVDHLLEIEQDERLRQKQQRFEEQIYFKKLQEDNPVRKFFDNFSFKLFGNSSHSSGFLHEKKESKPSKLRKIERQFEQEQQTFIQEQSQIDQLTQLSSKKNE